MKRYGNGIVIGKGGGSADYLYACVLVTYPAGASIKAVKGDIVVSSNDTSGLTMLGVPEPGDWTITATNDIDSASVSVPVTEQTLYTANIKLGVRLFKNGVYNVITGFTAANQKNATVEYGNDIVLTCPSSGSYIGILSDPRYSNIYLEYSEFRVTLDMSRAVTIDEQCFIRMGANVAVNITQAGLQTITVPMNETSATYIHINCRSNGNPVTMTIKEIIGIPK